MKWNDLFVVFKPGKCWEAVSVGSFVLGVNLTGLRVPRLSIISGCVSENVSR